MILYLTLYIEIWLSVHSYTFIPENILSLKSHKHWQCGYLVSCRSLYCCNIAYRMYLICRFQMTDASQFCQHCDCLFMWSGDICILCVVDSHWPRGNGGKMVAIWCGGMYTHVCL